MNGGGVGVATVLGLIFIVLRLVGVIAWSWVWVLSPFWIQIGMELIVFVIYLLVKGLGRL